MRKIPVTDQNIRVRLLSGTARELEQLSISPLVASLVVEIGADVFLRVSRQLISLHGGPKNEEYFEAAWQPPAAPAASALEPAHVWSTHDALGLECRHLAFSAEAAARAHRGHRRLEKDSLVTVVDLGRLSAAHDRRLICWEPTCLMLGMSDD